MYHQLKRLTEYFIENHCSEICDNHLRIYLCFGIQPDFTVYVIEFTLQTYYINLLFRTNGQICVPCFDWLERIKKSFDLRNIDLLPEIHQYLNQKMLELIK